MPEVMSIEVDEEFDPRSQESSFAFRDPEGNLNIKLVAGIALAVVLVLALIFVVVNPFGSKAEVGAPSEWKPKDPTVAISFLESYPAGDPIVTSLENALDGMADFYTSGDMTDVERQFDRAGRQYAILLAEQEEVIADPDLEGPAEVRLGPVGEVSQVDNVYIVRAIVNWTIPGKEGDVFEWDITMLREGPSNYLLSMIAESDPLAQKPIAFCSAAKLISELDTFDEVSQEFVKFPADEQLAVVVESYEIRLKTWEYLQRTVQNTEDKPDVDTIIAEFERVIGRGAESESPTALFEGNSSQGLEESGKSIQARVESQCQLDITNR